MENITTEEQIEKQIIKAVEPIMKIAMQIYKKIKE